MAEVYFLSFKLLLGESSPVQRAHCIAGISELKFCEKHL